MKLLKIALLLNLALMANIGHALEMLEGGTRILYSGADPVLPANTAIPVTEFSQFNLGTGASVNFSSFSSSWSVLNRVQGNAGAVINGINNGGTIQLISPAGLVFSGASIPDTRNSLSASAVPEAETYSMLLAGLGLIGAIIRRRSI